MHPYLPFAAIPLAATVAWYTASNWATTDPRRYHVPVVEQIEKPEGPIGLQPDVQARSDIRIKAFLPHLPPRAPAPDPVLVLHSVMTGAKFHLATINGEVVREGDSVLGYTVRNIDNHGVVLVRGSNTRTLPMRAIHDLPPPVDPGPNVVLKGAEKQHKRTDKASEFWAVFDSPQL